MKIDPIKIYTNLYFKLKKHFIQGLRIWVDMPQPVLCVINENIVLPKLYIYWILYTSYTLT